MKFIAIIIAIVALSSALTMKEKRLKSFNKLTYQSFFVEITNQITAGGPLTAILDTIEKFDHAIRDEQREHDAMWAIQEADCADEISFRTAEIKDGEESFQRAEIHHKTCSVSLSRAEVDLDRNMRDQADTGAALDALTAIRVAQHAVWVEENARHALTVDVLKDGLDFLDELVAGEATLLQLSQKTMVFIQHGTAIHLMQHFAPLITLFAQMASDENDAFVDEGAVERVRNMMENLIGKVRQNMDSLEGKENAQQEEFDGVAANLNATLRELENNEVRLNNHIDDMKNCVLEEQVVMTTSRAKVDRNADMLATAEKMCATFKMEYEVATEGRNEERDLLSIIRQMAEKRMVKYRDASTESKYGEDYGAEYENMDNTAAEYTSTTGDYSWQ